VQAGGLRPAVDDADPDQDVAWRAFCVFYEDIEVTVVIEDAGIE
jgi:hypothetical protein